MSSRRREIGSKSKLPDLNMVTGIKRVKSYKTVDKEVEENLPVVTRGFLYPIILPGHFMAVSFENKKEPGTKNPIEYLIKTSFSRFNCIVSTRAFIGIIFLLEVLSLAEEK